MRILKTALAIIAGAVYLFFGSAIISGFFNFSFGLSSLIAAVPLLILCVWVILKKKKGKHTDVPAPPVPQSPPAPRVVDSSDPLFIQAIDSIFDDGQCSVSMIQRRVKCGYAPAARYVDQMEALGIIGPYEGAAPRKVLISRTEWEKMRPKEVPHYEAPVIGTDQIIKNDLQRVDLMDGPQFEWWCAGLLRKNGFSNVEVTKASNDQGVDVLAEKGGIKYAIQCKRYSSDLGNTPIQEVHAGKAFYGCHVGVVMTNQHFTKGAVELAEKTGVLLWDRDHITDLMRAAEEGTSGKA